MEDHETAVARLEVRIGELERRVALLERHLVPTPPGTAQLQITGVKAANVNEAPLVLDNWDYLYREGEFGQGYYRIALKLRNAGTKQIKLIDASVHFADLLDQHLYGIKISPDIAIAPGKTHNESGDYGVNEYIQEQMRMRYMNKADIKATSEVRRIVFSDNTVLQV